MTFLFSNVFGVWMLNFFYDVSSSRYTSFMRMKHFCLCAYSWSKTYNISVLECVWCLDVLKVILEQTSCRHAIDIKNTASAIFVAFLASSAVETKRKLYTV